MHSNMTDAILTGTNWWVGSEVILRLTGKDQERRVLKLEDYPLFSKFPKTTAICTKSTRFFFSQKTLSIAQIKMLGPKCDIN